MKSFLKHKFLKTFLVCLSLLLVAPHSVADEQEEEGGGGFWPFTKIVNGWNTALDIFNNYQSSIEERNINDAPFIILPEYERPSQRVINSLGGGSYLGRNSKTREPCLLSDDRNALDVFSNFSPCMMNKLYSEKKNPDIAEGYGEYDTETGNLSTREPHQAFSLELRQDGVEEFCNCTLAKKDTLNLRSLDSTGNDDGSRKSDVVNNLIREGMKRIHDKFVGMQKEVGYAMTSREMSGYLIDDDEDDNKDNESEEKGSNQMKAKTTLALCMPSEMWKKMSEDGGMCSQSGIDRLATGMKDGTNFECAGVHNRPPAKRECLVNSMNEIKTGEGVDHVAEMAHAAQSSTARGARGPRIQNLSYVLNRHERVGSMPHIDEVQTRRGRRTQEIQGGGGLDFLNIGTPKSSREDFRNGEYSESLMEMVSKSRSNEFSDDGEKLWKRNTAPFQQALQSAISNAGRVPEGVLDQVNNEQLREFIRSNPFLEKRLAANINKSENDLEFDDEELELAVRRYVEKDLARVYLTLDSPEDYGLDELMGLTYAPDYYETLNECEEIQKTMISLCRAVDPKENEEGESLSSFFSDSRLMALFAEDFEGMQRGTADFGTYSELDAASYFFCQEAQKENAVADINQSQEKLEIEFANDSVFRQIEEERRDLHKLANKSIRALSRLRRGSEVARTQGTAVSIISGTGIINDSPSEDFGGEWSLDVGGGSSKADKTSPSVVSETSSVETSKKSLKVTSSDELVEVNRNEAIEDTSRQDSVEREQGSSQEQVDSSQRYNRFQNSFNSDQTTRSNYNLDGNLNGDSGELEEDQLSEEERALAAQQEAERDALGTEMSPLERNLMGQLESMREREAEMMERLEALSEKMEQDEKEEEIAEKNEEVEQLREQMSELQRELAEVRASKNENNGRQTQSRGERNENNANIFGPSSLDRSPSSSKRASAAPVGQRIPETATPTPGSLPKRSGTRAATDSSDNQTERSIGADSSLSSGGSGGATLTGTNSQSAARIRVPRSAKIAPPDASLTSLALNAEGNVALRETRSPGVLERVIFKTQDGEIVYENGYPVIDKRETVSVEETEDSGEEQIADSEPEQEESGREPASIEDELLEIERELRPRASHQELIETLQQNTEN